jgi:uncharacterized protein (DUF885 family)
MAEDINSLAADYWALMMRTHPTWAHLLGDFSNVGAYEDASREAEDQLIAELEQYAARARSVTGLEGDELVTAQVVASHAQTNLDVLRQRLPQITADPIFGPQATLPIEASMLGIPNAEVAEAVLTKVAGMGANYMQLAERIAEGVAEGRAPARFAVEGTITDLDRLLALPPADDPIVASFQLPEDVDDAGWRARCAKVVEEKLRPGMEAYRDALRDQALPISRGDDAPGLASLSGGLEAYDALLRYFTTTELTAQEIHEIGLAQVAKLADEYRELGAKALGTDDLQQIFELMRTDPKLHFTEGQQLVDASRIAMQRAWDAMGDWFEVLPQAPCAVEATMSGAKAFYYPPAADGSRGGTFFINVDDPTSWGTFELESMAFHEGIPGHHLQLAIAGELPDSVPMIRKFSETASYAEGWGLYTERLADEMGLYSTDIDRLGMLAADSMRACRLVLDTGLHALGWSRQQAIDYMLDNSPLHDGVVRPEVDRYIVTPGQATAYMIGRLEILRMRAEAQERQGANFEIKRFHSAVLDSGTLPLDVLDSVVRRRLP